MRIPKLRRKRARNMGVVRIGKRDHYCGVWGTPECHARYEAIIAAYLRERGQGGRGRRVVVGPSVGELASLYISHVEAETPAASRSSEPHLVRAALRRLVADRAVRAMAADRFTPRDLERYAESLGGDYAHSTVLKMARRVRQMYRWGVLEGLVPETAWLALSAARPPRGGRRPAPVGAVPDALLAATLPALPPAVRLLARFQRWTGARPGEACRLTMAGLDRAGEVWFFSPVEHKTGHRGHQRHVAVGPAAQRVIGEALSLSRSVDPAAPVFRTPAGAAYTTAAYRRSVRRACERLGLPAWSPNMLRHTRLTEVERRYGLDGARRVGGQRDVKMTMVYVERDRAEAAAIAKETG